MILKAKETTIAYRCPECGAGVMSMVGVFSLSGDLFRLRCDCGGSEMDINVSGQGKLRLSIPCIFCPKPHNFTVTPSLFFGREAFLLPCPITGVDIGFIGTEKAVREALIRTEDELRGLLEDNGIDSPSAFRQGEDTFLSDPQIYDIVMFVVKDLEEEGKIRCSCGEKGSYAVDIFDDHIRVYCETCGDFADIPTASPLAANAFLHTDELDLTQRISDQQQ